MLRLDKEAFEEICWRDWHSDEVSHVLVARRMELDMRCKLDEEAKHKVIHHQHGEVLATVKRFFGCSIIAKMKVPFSFASSPLAG